MWNKAFPEDQREKKSKSKSWFEVHLGLVMANLCVYSTGPLGAQISVNILALCLSFFWMRLALESVDWVQQINLPNVGGIHSSLLKNWIEQ